MRQLAAKDYAAATLSADRAMRALRMIERFYWDEAVNNDAARSNGISPVTSPATLSFETLPLHARLIARIHRSRGRNVLPGGNFDDPNLVLQVGLAGTFPASSPGSDPAARRSFKRRPI